MTREVHMNLRERQLKNLDNMIEYANTAFLARLNQQSKFTLSAFFITHECMRLALR